MSFFSERGDYLKSGDYCLIDQQYFSNNQIPEANTNPDRLYLHVAIQINDLYFLVPLETQLYQKNTHAIYSVPSSTRPKAGINFEKVLIFTEKNKHYLKVQSQVKLPKSQTQKIEDEIENIELKLNKYIQDYVKSCKKNREGREHKFRFSTLHSFKNLLT